MTGENNLVYEYRDSNAPDKKINYSYSKFHGKKFFEAWSGSRSWFILDSESASLEDHTFLNFQADWSKEEYINTQEILDFWIIQLLKNPKWKNDKVFLLIKRFEVTKKIYSNYNESMRPSDKTSYHEVLNYAKFAIILSKLYNNSNSFPALNALIKVNDIILGNKEFCKQQDNFFLQHAIKEEFKIINKLISKNL